jgi:hypothetical protein
VLLPKKYLMDMLVAAPITFTEDDQKLTKSDLPEEAYYFYSFFNPNQRFFSNYQGDEIPDHVLSLIKYYQQRNNNHNLGNSKLLILTPYFNLYKEEWLSGNLWRPLLDPFLISCLSGLKQSFLFLARWSDSGIFPLFNEMVADTMSFLESNAKMVENFKPKYPFTFVDYAMYQSAFSETNIDFKKLNVPNRWLNHFKAGKLFNFLNSPQFIPSIYSHNHSIPIQ